MFCYKFHKFRYNEGIQNFLIRIFCTAPYLDSMVFKCTLFQIKKDIKYKIANNSLIKQLVLMLSITIYWTYDIERVEQQTCLLEFGPNFGSLIKNQ